jgi:hypothetical protein
MSVNSDVNEDNEWRNLRQIRAESLRKAIEGQIKNNIECFKNIIYNTNTKGADYENVICELLNNYLGSRFDFYNRAHIIDSEMEYLKFFKTGANEIDVVGTFNTTAPKIVLKAGGLVIVPYDAVALLSQVKSKLDSQKLHEDLISLENIMRLKVSPNRFLPHEVSGFDEKRPCKPFRLLVYFQKSIDDNSMERLSTQYSEVWDALLLVDEEELLINRDLPFVNSLFKEGLQDKNPNKTFLPWKDAPFTILLTMITRTIPVPLAVDVNRTLLKIVFFARGERTGNQDDGEVHP